MKLIMIAKKRIQIKYEKTKKRQIVVSRRQTLYPFKAAGVTLPTFYVAIADNLKMEK